MARIRAANGSRSRDWSSSGHRAALSALSIGLAMTRLVRALRTPGFGSEEGAATAEYAIVIMAAVGFAGLLVVIMRSDEVRGILTELVRNALAFAG